MGILSIAVVYNSLFSNVVMRLIRVLRFFAKNIFLFTISKVTGGYLRNGVIIYVRSSVCVSMGLRLLFGCMGVWWGVKFTPLQMDDCYHKICLLVYQCHTLNKSQNT